MACLCEGGDEPSGSLKATSKYLTFLQEVMVELCEDLPLSLRQKMWFQHDGAPAHFSFAVHEHLHQTFGERWWIGRDLLKTPTYDPSKKNRTVNRKIDVRAKCLTLPTKPPADASPQKSTKSSQGKASTSRASSNDETCVCGLRIKFNDAATTTFEYPSEASLLNETTLPSSASSSPSSSLPSQTSITAGLPVQASPSGPTPGVPVPLGEW
ncbi:hypothetical protein ANN_17675 [Periplaneta americana]|uniref:Uncharacterized protein n=1 Tax=Periplaneta americana TaxID=6978 RepID=A0ABQ8STL1_PERAM|nr:hypothetical protein ANN_17675 [Periplaneta americana]